MKSRICPFCGSSKSRDSVIRPFVFIYWFTSILLVRVVDWCIFIRLHPQKNLTVYIQRITIRNFIRIKVHSFVAKAT
jgi:hypothetical protein